ncbi:OmpH family outer membrane protein [uncultured Winogradskyella sp.]|uniref:OmpH family outer membrane protein n=1 Tax=uncultured Winogradskyella sp. TaxID=395353 RepID=UPI0026362A16|nr:OmpH family outer membrane protein [uncultured Winogradskyella sp.]
MKHFKSLLFAAVLFIGATTFTSAQSKVAHIDTQKLIEAMPDYISAQAEIDKLKATYQAELQDQLTELNNKIKQYESEAGSQTAEENLRRKQEVTKIDQSITLYQQNQYQDMQKKNEALMKPIVEKAKKAIKEVAKAQGYEYVLDSAMLLVSDGKDLMADVKAHLKI